jgi:muramoyltetrapeptide carboxypeptidase
MSRNIRYPGPLKKGDKVAITAPSCGVRPAHHARLDLVLKHLRDQGFEVVEGRLLRDWIKHTSGPAEARAQEFTTFWEDESISAIMPPWGGEVLVEILPLLNFERLSACAPKWVSGYSDISTLLFPLTTLLNIATVHGASLMDLAPAQTDPLTTGLMPTLSLKTGDRLTQHSSQKFQKQWTDFSVNAEAPPQPHRRNPMESSSIQISGSGEFQRENHRRLSRHDRQTRRNPIRRFRQL